MTMLGLVVAAGLVMGLIAFRMTGGAAGVATASVGAKAIGGDPNAPRPSAADAVVDPQPETPPLAPDTESQNGEPTPPAKDAPEMQGPGTGDLPGTAAEPAPPSAPPAEPSSDTAPPSSDAPPQ